MIVARTIAEARAALRRLPRPLGFVPTMGALHAGHLGLVQAAATRCAGVAASVFVNPAQFGHDEDFLTYPRDETRDLRLLDEAGVAVVFAPEAREMYPDGFATGVHVSGPLTGSFEGASRPSHFDGVAVVVTKLLGVIRPDELFLGQKDAQQLAVVRRLARDLDLRVEVIGVPTLREPDGLAMSSRNIFLTPEQRAMAPGLYGALLAGAAAAQTRAASARDVVVAATNALLADRGLAADEGAEPGDGGPAFDLDYLAVVDADTFVVETDLGRRSLLIAAARLGSTRLIDNVPLHVPAAGGPAISVTTSAYPAEDATA